MNYALDALWWKINQKNVRDLASLLTAPTLWHTGCELPVKTLLGDTGFRYLLALDNNPQPLLDYLEEHFPKKFRLGFYAEHLLKFWFTYSPHWQLLADNIVLTENKQSIGAIDFIAQTRNNNIQEQKIYHIELTCKYYYSTSENMEQESFIGLAADDNLNKKVDKLKEQLQLSKRNSFTQIQNNSWKKLIPVSIVRGNAFSYSGELPINMILNPYAWAGKFYTQETLPAEWLDRHFVLLENINLLSPARIEESEIINFSQLKNYPNNKIIAMVSKRYDDYFHEECRFLLIC